MKSLLKTFLHAAIIGLLVGIAAFVLHTRLVPPPPRALDFYPVEIRAFLSSHTTKAETLLADSIAADAAIDAANARLEALPPSDIISDEFKAARRDFLQAGLDKLDHVRRVADAYDKAVSPPAPVAPADTGFLASIFAPSGAYKFAILVGILTALFCAAIPLLIRYIHKHAGVSKTFVTHTAQLCVRPSSNRELARHYIFLFQQTVSRCRQPNTAQKQTLLNAGIGELAALANGAEKDDISLDIIHAILNRFLNGELGQANATLIKDEWDPSEWENLKKSDPTSPLFTR